MMLVGVGVCWGGVRRWSSNIPTGGGWGRGGSFYHVFVRIQKGGEYGVAVRRQVGGGEVRQLLVDGHGQKP